MATSDKIKSEEVIEKDLFLNTQKSAKALSDQLAILEIGFEDIIKIQSKVLKTTKLEKAEDIHKVTKAIEETTKATKGLNEVKAAKVKISEEQAALNQLESKARRQNIEYLKAELILQDKHRGTIEKLNAANTQLRIQREKLNLTTKEGQEQLRKLNKMIDLNNAQIIKNSDQLKKAKLNVGNYSASIRAALAETGAFDNGLVRAIVTLRNLVTNLQAGKEGANKMGLALKGIAALGVVALITGLTAALKADQGVLDGFNKILARTKDGFAQLFGKDGGFVEFEERLQSSRIVLRKLTAEMQVNTLELEDQKQISEDTTLGFIERNAALEEYIRLQQVANKQAVAIARERERLAIAERNSLLKSGITPGNDILDRLNEAGLALGQAIDKEKDFTEIDLPQLIRKRRALELGIEEDLIRSKKRSSTISRDLLEKQVDDEKRQIEEREKDLIELNKIYKNTFDEQIRLFQNYTGKQINEQDLLAERDSIALAEKIKKLNLGEEQTLILATIIKKAQDDEVKATMSANKILEDKAIRLQKIEEIQREINKANREDITNDLEYLKNRAEIESQTLQTQVESNLNSREKLDLLKESLSDELIYNEQIYQSKAVNLKKQLEDDKKAAEATITDKKVLNEELLKLENQYNIDLGNLEQEQALTAAEIAKKNSDILIGIEKAKTTAIVNELTKVTSQVGTEIDKRSQLQQDAFQNEANMREKNIDIQQDLAARGLDNQLAFERAQQEKRELARKDALKRAEKQKEAAQLVEAYFNAYNAELSVEGTSPTRAATKALTDVMIAKGLSKSVVQFLAEGTDSVKGAGTETSDSVPAMLSVNEAVIPAKANKKHRGVSKSLIEDTFDMNYISMSKFAEAAKDIEKSSMERAMNIINIQSNSEIVSLLKDIKDKPIQQVDVDKLGNLIETVYKNGIKTVTTHKLNRI